MEKKQNKTNSVCNMQIYQKGSINISGISTAFELRTQRCVQTLPRMPRLRLWPRGRDGLLRRQRGEIVGGTDSNDKALHVFAKNAHFFVKFVISLRHNSSVGAPGLRFTSEMNWIWLIVNITKPPTYTYYLYLQKRFSISTVILNKHRKKGKSR